MASPVFDQSSHSEHNGTTSGTLSVSAAANTIVLIFVMIEAGGTPTRTVSSMSGGSLTWAQRGSVANGAGAFENAELWKAYAASGLSSATITVNLTGANSDCWSIAALSYTGANSSAPFDTNGGLPATSHDSFTSGSYSTSQADDMLVGIWGQGNQGSNPGTGTVSGWTNRVTVNTNNFNNMGYEIFEKSVSATQSSQTATIVPTSGTATGYVVLIDAITADGGGGGGGGGSKQSAVSVICGIDRDGGEGRFGRSRPPLWRPSLIECRRARLVVPRLWLPAKAA